jgi:hypothetical protein
MDGARKYGPYNWREEGVGASTYLSAAMRHLRAYLDGEQNAMDSGVHHLGHAMACLAILLDAEAVGNLVDDRPLPAPTAELMDLLKSGPLAVDRTSGAVDLSTEGSPELTRDNFIGADEIHVAIRPHHMDPKPVQGVTQAESEAAYRARMPRWMAHGPPRTEDPIDPIPPESANPGECC